MRISSDIAEVNSLLATYEGSTAKVFFFAVSRKRLAIKLYSPHRDLVLYVVAEACEKIHGAFAWDSCQLSVSKVPGKKEEICKLADFKADFELLSSSLIIAAEGEEHEFGDSLDSLLRP